VDEGIDVAKLQLDRRLDVVEADDPRKVGDDPQSAFKAALVVVGQFEDEQVFKDLRSLRLLRMAHGLAGERMKHQSSMFGAGLSLEAALDELTNDPGFEQGPATGVQGEYFRRANSQQPAGQSGVEEIQFRRLDESFPEVAVVGRQQENEVTRFED
jgi:hypothetical protein